MKALVERIFLRLSHRICFSFAVAVFSVLGGQAGAALGAVFVLATVDFSATGTAGLFIFLVAFSTLVMVWVHYLLFGFSRLWGRRWELRSLHLVNDAVQGLTIKAGISTADLEQVVRVLERLPSVNGMLACVFALIVIATAFVGELLASGLWSNGFGILRGGGVILLLYGMFTFIVTDMMTMSTRRDGRRLLARRGVWQGPFHTSSIRIKLLFILLVMAIGIFVTATLSSMSHLPHFVFLAILFAVMTILIEGGMVVLIFLSITRPLQEIRETARQVMTAETADLIAGSLDGEFISTAEGLYDAARQVVQYRTELQEMNVNLERAVGERTRRLSLLHEISKAVKSTLDLGEVLTTACQQLVESFEVGHSSVLLFEKSHTLGIIAAEFPSQDMIGLQVPLTGFAAAERVIQTAQPLEITDAQHDPAMEPVWDVLRSLGIQSILIVPLVINREVAGVFTLDTLDAVRHFSEAEIELAQTIATQLSMAVANAKLFGEMERRVVELAALTDAGQALSSALRVQEVLELIYEQTRRVMYGENMIIMLYDKATQEIECRFSNNPEDVAVGARFPAGTGLTGYIIKNRQSVLLKGNVVEGIKELGLELVGQPSASWLGVPMIVGGRVLGVIILQHYTEPNVYEESDRHLLETIANQAAIAMENATLFEVIQQEKQYSESLILNSPAAIVVAGNDHKILSWNPAAERLFGYAEAEAVGRYVDDLVATSDLESSEGMLAEALSYTQQLAKGNTVRAITRRSHRDGTLLDVELLAVPLKVKGGQIGYIAIYHDITELEQARQQAEAASRAKSLFLSTVSHELLTPLTSVLGFARLIDKRLDKVILPAADRTDPQVQQAVDQVRTNVDILLSEGKRLTTLITDVLDLVKIESGQADWEMRAVSIKAIVEQAVAETDGLFQTGEVELQMAVAAGLPPVTGDHDRLVQVVRNLISNAAKFTKKGYVRVTADKLVDLEPIAHLPVAPPIDDWLLVRVQDTGVGIEFQDYERVFEQFVQLGDELTEKPQGTGLGLSICKNIVEHHGGQIWVESALEKGTTLSFILPCSQDDTNVGMVVEKGAGK